MAQDYKRKDLTVFLKISASVVVCLRPILFPCMSGSYFENETAFSKRDLFQTPLLFLSFRGKWEECSHGMHFLSKRTFRISCSCFKQFQTMMTLHSVTVCHCSFYLQMTKFQNELSAILRVRNSNETKRVWRLRFLNLTWFLFAGFWQLTPKCFFCFLVRLLDFSY